MPRRIIAIVALIAAAAALTWALWPKPVVVETAVIARQSMAVEIEEEGKSRIRDVFTVSAPITGQMLRVNLHAGDEVVEKLTVVASIKPADPGLLDARARRVAEAAAEAVRAGVDLAGAQVRQAEAQLGFLQSELARATSLVRRGTISERAFEKAKLDVETAAAALESAKAALMVRQRELESAEAALIESSGAARLSCCIEVRSPVSGRILRILTESEQVVLAGTPLAEIGDPADVEIAVDLLSRDAVQIKPGASAVIEGWGGAALPAKVTRIDPSAITKVSALGIEEQRVPVVLTLEGDRPARAGLGHGFRVVVRILLWKGENLLAVPIGALFRQGADWAVYTVENGSARLRPVKLGARNGEVAEIADGLAEGMTVILHPSDLVEDGTRVTGRLAH